jgi:hypothetical protein
MQAENELAETLRYLETTQAQLLAHVQEPNLNRVPPDGGWTQGQVIAHLIRSERYFYPLFALLPKLARWPGLIGALDRMNVTLCKLLGMGFESQGDQPSAGLRQFTPQFKGRFFAPAFLKPRRKRYEWQALLAGRARTRRRTLAAIEKAGAAWLKELRFSHPILGSFTLLEFVLFLGKHEEWHTEQLKRIARTAPRES